LPIYYPGTVDAAGASVIDVLPGVDFSGIDFRIAETFAVRVRGHLTNGVTGQPMSVLGTSLNLVPRRGTVATGSSQRGTASVNGAFEFEFRHMAPGAYDLVATANAANGVRLAASQPIDVANGNIDDLNLTLQPQLSIGGRVAIENMQPNGENQSLAGIRVELRREPYTPELLIILPNVAPDGTFAFSGVTPGDYRLKVETRGFKGYIKSARFGGVDALNPPFRIDGPGQIDIVIGLTAGSLEAVALDETQKVFPDATVVLIPDPPRRERFDLYAAAAGPSGRVRFTGLAPGDYKLFAWDDVPADAWQDPDFIRAFEDRGRPVHITEGSNETIQLNVLKGTR
jgi:hypothetical protein